jgi:hypothetical protein
MAEQNAVACDECESVRAWVRGREWGTVEIEDAMGGVEKVVVRIDRGGVVKSSGT